MTLTKISSFQHFKPFTNSGKFHWKLFAHFFLGVLFSFIVIDLGMFEPGYIFNGSQVFQVFLILALWFSGILYRDNLFNSRKFELLFLLPVKETKKLRFLKMRSMDFPVFLVLSGAFAYITIFTQEDLLNFIQILPLSLSILIYLKHNLWQGQFSTTYLGEIVGHTTHRMDSSLLNGFLSFLLCFSPLLFSFISIFYLYLFSLAMLLLCATQLRQKRHPLELGASLFSYDETEHGKDHRHSQLFSRIKKPTVRLFCFYDWDLVSSSWKLRLFYFFLVLFLVLFYYTLMSFVYSTKDFSLTPNGFLISFLLCHFYSFIIESAYQNSGSLDSSRLLPISKTTRFVSHLLKLIVFPVLLSLISLIPAVTIVFIFHRLLLLFIEQNPFAFLPVLTVAIRSFIFMMGLSLSIISVADLLTSFFQYISQKLGLYQLVKPLKVFRELCVILPVLFITSIMFSFSDLILHILEAATQPIALALYICIILLGQASHLWFFKRIEVRCK